MYFSKTQCDALYFMKHILMQFCFESGRVLSFILIYQTTSFCLHQISLHGVFFLWVRCAQ